MRNFTEGERQWQVRERYAHDMRDLPRQRCLVFMSEAVIRRVYEYPAAWFDLSDDTLRGMMEAPVRPPSWPWKDGERH